VQDPCSNSKLTLLVLQELVALNMKHKDIVFAYGNVEQSSINTEAQLREVGNFTTLTFIRTHIWCYYAARAICPKSTCAVLKHCPDCTALESVVLLATGNNTLVPVS